MNSTKQAQAILRYCLFILMVFISGCQMKPSGLGTNRLSFAPNQDLVNRGGSGVGGVITLEDKVAVEKVVAAAAVLQPPAGLDTAISRTLQDEMNRVIALERRAKNVEEKAAVLSLKWALVPKILTACANKMGQFAPIPGQPLIGDWSGNGGCGLTTFAINGPGNKQVYATGGGIPGGQVGAAPDGTFTLRSSSFNSTSGADSGYQSSDLSGVGTLTGNTSSTTKYGTSNTPCNVAVELVNPKSPIPGNYQNAMKLMGACYRKSFAFLGMDSIFNNIDPALANLLAEQMLR
ncbi:MAG: hypothetical protein EXR74_05270 [Bdellovibrionales bacterium]|nr:hypothetical protein [Bdellovibrionales bacterium]